MNNREVIDIVGKSIPYLGLSESFNELSPKQVLRVGRIQPLSIRTDTSVVATRASVRRGNNDERLCTGTSVDGWNDLSTQCSAAEEASIGEYHHAIEPSQFVGRHTKLVGRKTGACEIRF